jgi:predicted DCC family thiol-disulfide oxidoreductase YuxK
MLNNMDNIPKEKKLILFDGVCNLCNSFVNKIIKKDKKNSFIFASLDSEIGNQVAKHLNIDTNKIESIILYEVGVSYDLKSTAALKIMKEFGGIWFITRIGFLLPESLRDSIYDIVAKNRYKWFGKKDSCMIPTPELKAKFLD